MQAKKLQIIPLGGLGEFGMNCLAVRWEDDIIVIDAGLMFPETELLGVDIVVPDITYLIENKQHVRGIVLTHGHEDHIGGLPWILNELKVPVYATEFTLAYVEDKLEEHELLDEIELIEIEPKEKFTIGPFTIEPIRVTHSLVDCVALAIEHRWASLFIPATSRSIFRRSTTKPSTCTPLPSTASGACWRCYRTRPTSRGPATRPASARSFLALTRFSRRPGRNSSLVASRRRSTASALRMELAREHGRKVAVVGRSMVESTEIAQDLGYIEIPPGLVINPGQMRDFPPEQMMILISGTQGEPMSALSRAAVDNHKHAHIEPATRWC